MSHTIKLVDRASAPGVTRTPGQRFRKPLLYPPELQGPSREQLNHAGCPHETVTQRGFTGWDSASKSPRGDVGFSTSQTCARSLGSELPLGPGRLAFPSCINGRGTV